MPIQLRARSGRVLVECIVALMLLSITTLAVAGTARGTLALNDDSALVQRAQALATTRAEDAIVAGCAGAGSGLDVVPRVQATWQLATAPHAATLTVDLELTRSPIAFDNASAFEFHFASGGVC